MRSNKRKTIDRERISRLKALYRESFKIKKSASRGSAYALDKVFLSNSSSCRDAMFLERKLQKDSPRSGGAKRKPISNIFIAANIALLWSAGPGVLSWIYKHSAPPEPAYCTSDL
jgi:hypothetical protein